MSDRTASDNGETMKPIGPLMREHRLIEKTLGLFEGETKNINELHRVDAVFIDTVVDFIRTYTDRTHHGKEEDILFRDMAKKKLSLEHAKIMNDLIEEHKYARGLVRKLVETMSGSCHIFMNRLTQLQIQSFTVVDRDRSLNAGGNTQR